VGYAELWCCKFLRLVRSLLISSHLGSVSDVISFQDRLRAKHAAASSFYRELRGQLHGSGNETR
jgi:hypothetical protein